MKSNFKKAILLPLFAFAALSAGSISASAQTVGFELHFGTHQSPKVRIYNSHRGYKNHYHTVRNQCRPRKALKKARHKYGVRHGRITRANHRRVVIRGYEFGHRVKLVFANRKGCPLIAYRAR